jgi:hypothetical protein
VVCAVVVRVVVVRSASTLSALSFCAPLVRLCVQAIVASKPGRITSIDTFRGIALCIMMYVEASTTHFVFSLDSLRECGAFLCNLDHVHLSVSSACTPFYSAQYGELRGRRVLVVGPQSLGRSHRRGPGVSLVSAKRQPWDVFLIGAGPWHHLNLFVRRPCGVCVVCVWGGVVEGGWGAIQLSAPAIKKCAAGQLTPVLRWLHDRFMWLMGVSMALSLSQQRRVGATKGDMTQKIVLRSIKLFCIGRCAELNAPALHCRVPPCLCNVLFVC